jgi:catechol 2,3-dioxygenase-like lactoylglutathione lyase family enzyme
MSGQSIVCGYRHTGIIVKDMAASLKFYRDILGIEVIQEFTDGTDYINTITGLKNGVAHFIKMKTPDGFVLELLEYTSHPTELIKHPIINVGICHIALAVRNADEAHKVLTKAGVKVLSEPVLSSEKIAKVFFCLDPNNIRVEMVEMVNQ